jgi:hypothetical protein
VELKEDPNLNGDLLDDLLDGRVSGRPSDGDLALNAMFAAVASDAVNSGEAAKRVLNFRNQHAIYDDDYVSATHISSRRCFSIQTAGSHFGQHQSER